MNFSYLGILEFAMNVGFSQNGFSANKIPSFQIPSFVTPTKTFLVLSFPVSCVNRVDCSLYRVSQKVECTEIFQLQYFWGWVGNGWNHMQGAKKGNMKLLGQLTQCYN